ncbi:MAG TPA: hypothetical protein VGE21_12815 [Flavobacteriales bacterium]
MPLFRDLRSGENFHILLWLFKDLFWVMDVHIAGVIMVVPTVAMALWIAWKSRADQGELAHSLAVVFWITANSTWMIGEFFLNDGLRPIVALLFASGLACVAIYYAVFAPRRRRRMHAPPSTDGTPTPR